MKKSEGFKRLKGMASFGAVGLSGLFAIGSARAATITTGFSITTGSAVWGDFGNNTSFPSSSTVTTTNGNVFTSSSSPSAFCFSDGNVTTVTNSGNYGDAYDCAMILAVDGVLFVNPDSDVDLTGNTVTSDVVNGIVPGIDAQIQYRIFSHRRVARGLFTLTNTGPGPISINAAILGDYGSDSNTTVIVTSDTDPVIEPSDLWYITNDASVGNGTDAIVTTTRYGVDAEVVPFNALTPVTDGAVYGLRYPLDIPSGATVRIMTFHEMGPDDLLQFPAQVAAAKDFESMTAVDAAGFIDDLDQAVRDSIVNYGDSDIIFKNGFE